MDTVESSGPTHDIHLSLDASGQLPQALTAWLSNGILLGVISDSLACIYGHHWLRPRQLEISLLAEHILYSSSRDEHFGPSGSVNKAQKVGKI